ncbi:MAG: 4Fe-4S dicluster domain-containing protein [Fusobacteriaceae bacterium]|nr:4Fe-4S dicluster domain-containing protein [Fusobacteriaceae bacterium]
MKRDIVVIDEKKCTGCGLCVPNCHEGALQIIDGKARLISDLYCDGLGACLGHCPEGAMTIEKKEVEEYDERKVMIDNIIPAGANTIKAHISHLRDHNAMDFYNTALETLKEFGIQNPLELEAKEAAKSHQHQHGNGGGCPGSKMMSFGSQNKTEATGNVDSQLTQWPVQLHLVSPQAPYFKNSDLLLAADCTAYAVGDFHSKHLKNRSLAIACPKLDDGQDIYVEKLVSMIDNNNLNTITCMIMEVPCCGGLLAMAKQAVAKAKRKIPLKLIMVGIKGEIVREEWV